MEYKTIKNETSTQFTQQHSRFISYIKPVQSEDEAVDFINSIKQKHWDASHNVYAYAFRSGISRYSDDGEPQGTAGIPVLEVLKKEGIVDACIVVTRYFGGTLLGSGGLVRAYSKGAKDAVKAGEVVKIRLCKVVKIICDYNVYSKLQNLVVSHNGKIENTDFGEMVNVFAVIAVENTQTFEEELAEISSGKASFEIIDEKFLNI